MVNETKDYFGATRDVGMPGSIVADGIGLHINCYSADSVLTGETATIETAAGTTLNCASPDSVLDSDPALILSTSSNINCLAADSPLAGERATITTIPPKEEAIGYVTGRVWGQLDVVKQLGPKKKEKKRITINLGDIEATIDKWKGKF